MLFMYCRCTETEGVLVKKGILSLASRTCVKLQAEIEAHHCAVITQKQRIQNVAGVFSLKVPLC